MRQWPGNGADLDFRGVIRGCTALVVAAPVIAGELTGRFMQDDETAAFLASEAGAAAKKLLFAFRLWCVVELHAALEAGIPVVIRAGKAAREGDAVKFDTEGAVMMLSNLSYMIDVERAECAVRADYDREMDAVRNGEGVETVNKRVAGAVYGGSESALQRDLAVDAAVCGEPEALRALPDYGVKAALDAAAAGGRLTAVEELVARGVVDLASEYYPLFAAAKGGHHEVVAALIAARATVDLADNDGVTPLLAAWRNGHHEVESALLAAGAHDAPRFYSSTITPSADGFDFAAIVAASRDHIAKEDGAPTCPHSYVRGWDLRKCERCDEDVGDERLATEEAAKVVAEFEDSSIDASARGEQLRARGVKIAFLLAFTEALACWDWPTWRVCDEIIKPATAGTRCRYSDLPEVRASTASSTRTNRAVLVVPRPSMLISSSRRERTRWGCEAIG